MPRKAKGHVWTYYTRVPCPLQDWATGSALQNGDFDAVRDRLPLTSLPTPYIAHFRVDFHSADDYA